MERNFTGTVVRATGSWYDVLRDGVPVRCRIRGRLRLKGVRSTNPVVVGDEVRCEEDENGDHVIVDIVPRRNYVIRRASNLSKESHIIASNLDQAFLVVTFAAPMTATVFIDRFLATAEAYRVPVVIVVNKIDALDEEWLEFVDSFAYLYESIGYGVRRVSAETGEGIDGLRAMLEGKVTLFSGNSGVGKSTLINRLIPGLDLKTAAISEAHQTGMHTTTFSEMYPLAYDAGGYIIDTPGVKGFGTIDFNVEEVAHYFPEIFRESADCKYNNCTHIHEPGCAVKRALEEHRISESRYASYLSIIDDSAPDKYRKPF